MKIKYGIKIRKAENGQIYKAECLVRKGVFDYIEIAITPETNPKVSTEIDYILHDSSDCFIDEKSLSHSLEIADNINARYIILHPGFGKMEDAIRTLEKFRDKRILIENMPKIGMGGEPMLGYNTEEMRILMGKTFGFCMDFGHAACAAASTKTDYKKTISEMANLKPSVFHLSDRDIKNPVDDHLDIGKGSMDMKFIMEVIEKNDSKYVTIETPDRKGGIESFIKNLEKLKNLSK